MRSALSHAFDDAALSRFASNIHSFRDEGGGQVVGYARDLAGGARLAGEVSRLSEAGCAQVFAEAIPGRSVIRPQLQRAVAAASPGDAIAVLSFGRLTWREDELCEILAALEVRGLHLLSALEGFDTRRALDGFAIGALWTFFREHVALSREREVVRRAPGRKPAISDETWLVVAPGLLDKTVKAEDVAAELNVSRSAVYRRLAACA